MSAKRLAKNGAMQPDDAMVGLEPGDVMRLLFAADLAETQLRLHPLDVVTHGIGHRDGSRHVGIIWGREQIAIACATATAGDRAGQSARVAMQDRRARQADEFCRHVERLRGGAASRGRF